MTDSRDARIASPRTWCAVGALAAVFAACAASPAYAHHGPPHGPLPHSLTWHAPPTDLLVLPGDGGCARLPSAVTDVDVWLTDREGRPVWRLRQRGRAFRHGGRALVRYSRDRSICSGYGASRFYLIVYGWRS